MSRKNRSTLIDLSREQDLYESSNKIELHASRLFFVKRKKGVILNKIPGETKSISILDENLEEVSTNSRSVFFFDDERINYMLLIETMEGDYIEFVFSPEQNDFIKRKSALFPEWIRLCIYYTGDFLLLGYFFESYVYCKV